MLLLCGLSTGSYSVLSQVSNSGTGIHLPAAFVSTEASGMAEAVPVLCPVFYASSHF